MSGVFRSEYGVDWKPMIAFLILTPHVGAVGALLRNASYYKSRFQILLICKNCCFHFFFQEAGPSSDPIFFLSKNPDIFRGHI